MDALPKVIASARSDPAARGPEAIKHLRRARADLAIAEPAGDIAAILDWWLETLDTWLLLEPA